MKIQRAFHSQIDQIRSFNRPARLFLFATIMDGIIYSGWNLFFNFYILERGFSRDFLGLVNAVPSAAILLLGIPLGQLSDRIGRKNAMLLGVGISIFAMALQVTLHNPAMVLAAAFVGGAAASLWFLSQAPFMMQVSDQNNRTLLFSLNFGMVTIAGAVGNVFAGQLPALFGGWLQVPERSATAYQVVLLSSALLSFFTLIPLLFIHEPHRATQAARTGQPGPSLWHVLRQPLTIQLALPNLMIGSGAAILIPYVNVFFAERFAVSDQTLGVLFSLSALLTGVGTIIGPHLSTSLGGKIRTVVFTQGASLVFLLLMGFSPALWLVGTAYLVRGTLMNMAVPLYDAFAMEQVDERHQATVNSVKSLAWQVGWVIGPYVSGLVQMRYGFSPLFIATSVLYAGSTIITWAFFSKREAAPQPQPTIALEAVNIEGGMP